MIIFGSILSYIFGYGFTYGYISNKCDDGELAFFISFIWPVFWALYLPYIAGKWLVT